MLGRRLLSAFGMMRPDPPMLSVENLTGYAHPAPTISAWTGEKTPLGYGLDHFDTVDLVTLRSRSSFLFRRNLYARGIIRRLVTNVIGTGLDLEATPAALVLGLDDEEATAWDHETEQRFDLWARSTLPDETRARNLYRLQAVAYREALVDGDVLVVLGADTATGRPTVRLVRAANVRTPMEYTPPPGRRVVHGVELDAAGKHLGYWVASKGAPSTFVPAWGKSGRRLAWLLYANDERVDAVRGEPLLSLVMQVLRNLDRYREAATIKAEVNSMLALFIKKTSEKVSTRGFGLGAIRKDDITVENGDGTTEEKRFQAYAPGVVLEELQAGEEPVAFGSQGTDVKFGEFEAAIVAGISWALEIPGEILTLAFSHNYSASAAAVNEFRLFLDRARYEFGEQFCSPIYREWVVVETLSGRLVAGDLRAALLAPARALEVEAWLCSEWAGAIKPSTDPLKQVRAGIELIDAGLALPSRITRELTGANWERDNKRRDRELEQLGRFRSYVAKPAPSGSIQGETKGEQEPPVEADDPEEEKPVDEEQPEDSTRKPR